jgi:DNA (cytosine-5)-methyltransferase 1
MTPKIEKPKILGLFSGGGGLEIGFAMSEFSIAASVELIPEFCRTLSANKEFFSNSHNVICKDIAEFIPSQHGITQIDFVIGGPPCQSFSAAGRRAGGVFGLNDIRGSLFWHYCRILKELKPRGFLFENVRGILSANNKEAWSVIRDSFSELGYTLHFQVLDAAEYGVPQHRERLLMVGVENGIHFSFPKPTHGPASKNCVQYVSAQDAIADLQDSEEKYAPYGGKYESELLEIPPGSNYLHFTEKMGHPAPKFAWRSRFSDFLYVADPMLPTKTIVASPGKWAGPFHWKKRKFTIAELKRLFSFPDEYVLLGSEIVKMKQLGNSVPPRLANIMAEAVAHHVFGFPSDLEFVNEGFQFDHDQRKGRKAKDTKGKVVLNSRIYGKKSQQPLLFDCDERFKFEKKMTINKKLYYRDFRDCSVAASPKEKHMRLFNARMTLKDGCWKILAKSDENIRKKASIKLLFHRPVLEAFDRIEAEIEANDFRFISAAWDCINMAIASSTSYDCVQKLYGHFTEPYPMFTMSFSYDEAIGDQICFFQALITNFSYLNEYHPLSELVAIFSKQNGLNSEGSELAQWLRKLGYDIRTNETNRTIPDGFFRCCYPFPVALNSYNYTTWREKGSHATADRTSIPE